MTVISQVQAGNLSLNDPSPKENLIESQSYEISPTKNNFFDHFALDSSIIHSLQKIN